MPDVFAPLTDALTTGVVLAWRRSVGDVVRKGDVLGEIETEKATLEIQAPEDGVIVAVLVAEGTPVGRDVPLLRLGSRPLATATTTIPRGAAAAPASSTAHTSPAAAPPAHAAADDRCRFCHTLLVGGRIDCVRCGAPR